MADNNMRYSHFEWMDSAIRLALQNVSFWNKETTRAIFDTHKIEKDIEKLRCTISSTITQGFQKCKKKTKLTN